MEVNKYGNLDVEYNFTVKGQDKGVPAASERLEAGTEVLKSETVGAGNDVVAVEEEEGTTGVGD